MLWYSGLEPICRTDVPLREHTWYKLGGPARWLFTPRAVDELLELLARCRQHGIAWRVLGRGANVLVRDSGCQDAVIRLAGPAWETLRFAAPAVHAGAGLDLPRLVRRTIDAGLVGLECLAGIPGTLGGALRMNAGGRHGNLGTFVRSADLFLPDGTRGQRTAAELDFTYRRCRLDGGILLGAVLVLAPGSRHVALETFRRIWREKYETQPPVSARTAGCIFKNPPGHSAGRLLDEAGLKGARRGGAEISPRHANFIVADADATAQNVLDLIALARERVHSRTGIVLELEVEIW